MVFNEVKMPFFFVQENVFVTKDIDQWKFEIEVEDFAVQRSGDEGNFEAPKPNDQLRPNLSSYNLA